MSLLKYLLVSMLLAYVGCATNHAAKVRENLPVTVGISNDGLGAMFRPSSDFAIGATTGGLFEESVDLKISSKFDRDFLGRDTFKLQETETGIINLFGHYFPWHDSAFYFGVRLTRKDYRYAFDVRQFNGYGLAGENIKVPRKLEPIPDRPVNQDPSSPEARKSQSLTSNLARVTVEASTTQMKIPFGWSWIWANGVSFLLEIGGPVVVFSEESKLGTNGESQGADKEERDIVVSELENEFVKDHAFSPYISIGYSF